MQLLQHSSRACQLLWLLLLCLSVLLQQQQLVLLCLKQAWLQWLSAQLLSAKAQGRPTAAAVGVTRKRRHPALGHAAETGAAAAEVGAEAAAGAAAAAGTKQSTDGTNTAAGGPADPAAAAETGTNHRGSTAAARHTMLTSPSTSAGAAAGAAAGAGTAAGAASTAGAESAAGAAAPASLSSCVGVVARAAAYLLQPRQSRAPSRQLLSLAAAQWLLRQLLNRLVQPRPPAPCHLRWTVIICGSGCGRCWGSCSLDHCNCVEVKVAGWRSWPQSHTRPAVVQQQRRACAAEVTGGLGTVQADLQQCCNQQHPHTM